MFACIFLPWHLMRFSLLTSLYFVPHVTVTNVQIAVFTNSCKQPTWRTFLFSYIFIPFLYVFRTPLYPSSGEWVVLIRHLVYVTLCRWPSSLKWHIPNVVLIQLILLMMGTGVLETCREIEWIYTKKEMCVKLVIYKNWTEMDRQRNMKFIVVTEFVICFNIPKVLFSVSICKKVTILCINWYFLPQHFLISL
jgi:hypothetical protein